MDVVNFFNNFNPFKAIRMSHQTVEVFGIWHLFFTSLPDNKTAPTKEIFTPS